VNSVSGRWPGLQAVAFSTGDGSPGDSPLGVYSSSHSNDSARQRCAVRRRVRQDSAQIESVPPNPSHPFLVHLGSLWNPNSVHVSTSGNFACAARRHVLRGTRDPDGAQSVRIGKREEQPATSGGVVSASGLRINAVPDMSTPTDQRARSANPQANTADLGRASCLAHIELVPRNVRSYGISRSRLPQHELQVGIHVPPSADELE
jgi:hypothetical protein